MTFLQPFILWGLPLVLLPVIIHLINRLRHRRQRWAAMQFLISATRSSVSQAKLRQFLVLLFRVLAVLALILFLSRPLAGGWLGWAVASAPDTILILLDRSASMETRLAGTETSRREQALKLFSEAARGFQESSHLVVIDSATRAPQQIANAAMLPGLTLAAPTDTAADLPGLLQTAVRWLVENRAGTTEIWIASDLQQSDWQPDDSRWASVLTQLASLPQKVRVRLLTFDQASAGNASIALREITRRRQSQRNELSFVLDLQRQSAAPGPLPVTVNLDGVVSQHELQMDSQSLRWRHQLDLGAKTNGGWGRFTLPSDANGRDNSVFFVYGSETPLHAEIVADDAASRSYFQLATAVLTGSRVENSETLSPANVSRLDLTRASLLLWQGPLPDEATAERIRGFTREGGVVMFFPPTRPDAQRFDGLAWGEVQTAEGETTFRVPRWDEDQGPLAKTDEGISLPLPDTRFAMRQALIAPEGTLAALAAYADGTPFLARKTFGRGEIYFCTSLPRTEWSSLGDGPVLVPMLQRLLQAGGRRLEQASLWTAGQLSPAELDRRWSPLEAADSGDIRVEAGLYRSGERLAAVNRPSTEDDWTYLEAARAQRLFEGVSFQLFQDNSATDRSLQGEVWRWLLTGMLVFLLVEGFLLLPAKGAARETSVIGEAATGKA